MRLRDWYRYCPCESWRSHIDSGCHTRAISGNLTRAMNRFPHHKRSDKLEAEILADSALPFFLQAGIRESALSGACHTVS